MKWPACESEPTLIPPFTTAEPGDMLLNSVRVRVGVAI